MQTAKIAVVGLGYVGLPLAVEFCKKFSTVGFDIDQRRVNEIANGNDRTREVEKTTLMDALEEHNFKVSTRYEDIKNSNVYIVTVPTPIDRNKRPDFAPLLGATEIIGSVLTSGDIVIYESTVYPGATEEICVPVLEKKSGLKFNHDFFCGYSPERINPGDKVHTITKIKKVTSGSNPEVAKIINGLYGEIITAGTHLAPSIKVAEAAKVIENAQRDINIAFMNELAVIFSKIGVDTRAVLRAASTKWNFLSFEPGLVGGHCIGVDPYYLTHKAQEVGHNPEILLAGRRLNDSMGMFVATQIIKLICKKGFEFVGAKILILGITFKENCPDIRNSKVIDVINELTDFGAEVYVHDPHADGEEVEDVYGVSILKEMSSADLSDYGAVVLAVAHEEYKNLEISEDRGYAIYDIKGLLQEWDARL